MLADITAYFDRRSEVPGWFSEEDFRLFDWLLAGQGQGDLLEIGAFQGSSAILLGLHRRQGESFTVCDLFGPPEAEDNRAESGGWYRGLTRESFERNFCTFVPELPFIVQASSLTILDHVRPGTCRFVHIDGCHLYNYVRADIAAGRRILSGEGILACDDWRTRHTPGVTVAVLEQVVTGGLHPIAITEAKFYGSWDAAHAAQLRSAVGAWAVVTPEVEVDVQSIRGLNVPRLYLPTPPRSTAQRVVGRLNRALRGVGEKRSR